jgi:D-glycero-alpha-D-manno-heptose-7-phosphate kinase
MIISQTPLRLSLAGGGTDLPEYYRAHGGAVLTMAIDKYVYVVVKERFDDRIYVNYSQKEIVDSIDQLQHELVRESMRKTGIDRGVEITTMADVPSEGSGLGSSSSVTVGLLNALYALAGRQVTADHLAQTACDIEVEILGRPIGVQDQYIAAFGGLQFLQFHRDGHVCATRLPVGDDRKRELVRHLLLFYTNRTRKAANILEEQRANIPHRLEELARLREMAFDASRFVAEGELDRLGDLLNSSWAVKRTLAGQISDDGLDEMYERARSAGALGGKIAGAGGGGFLLLYCPLNRQRSVRESLSAYRELPIAIARDGSKIILNIR